MNEPWTITLFGGLRVERGPQPDGQLITRFRTQKVASLFAYLSFYLRQAHAREILVEMLWPESDGPIQRNNLSVALSSLRHQFEPPGTPQGTILRADRFSVGLNPANVTTDVVRFEQALKDASRAGSVTERAQHLTHAVELYQGPLLPGFYEDWITSEQERLSGLFFDAVTALVAYLESIGDLAPALAHARHAVAIDPLLEEVQGRLIRLLSISGQPGSALRQYKEYERLLKDRVGEEPSAPLQALFQRIERESGLIASVPDAVSLRRHVIPPAIVSRGGPDTVTFLLTDIEGSTRLLQQAPEAYATARERHHHLLRTEFSRHGGQEMKETGDGFIAVFSSAGSALACAISAQKVLAEEPWPKSFGPVKVRMTLHTGDVNQGAEEGQYQGLALHHASRMLTAAHGGQILCSEATATLVRLELTQEGIRLVDLGIYRLRDMPAPERLFQVEYPHMAQAQFPPLAAEAGYLSRLPARLNRFFGRSEEIPKLQQLLNADGVRLVTLTGPGGTGKTRLALEVAERLVESFAGSVCFVPLADLSDPSLIPGAILESLGIPRSPQQEPLVQALEALAKKRTLLVLDNMEHLVDGGARIVQTLLGRVASLTLLVTSRQLLGLSAEREFVLSPLPTPNGPETPEQLSLFDSVQLFIDRAQQAMPHFQVTNANAAAVAALVAGLEGIPLAIELAAARVQVLTPAQMLTQLSHRFDLLTSRKRDVSERQRTLRGAVEWSYRLLSPELQRFFCRLSVFRGGWTLETAEQVCEESLALDYLALLQECSLVHSHETDIGLPERVMRFRMLETLREFAETQMDAPASTYIRQRHLDYFLSLAKEAADKHLQGPRQKEWLNRLDSEQENLRTALRFSMDTGAVEAGVRLAGDLVRFWDTRGYLSEGRWWLSSVLQAAGEQPVAPEWRARAFTASGILAFSQGDIDAARGLYEQGLALVRETGDQRQIANLLNNLANAAQAQGDLATARSLHEEALAIRREIGDPWGVADSLRNLGVVFARQGDSVKARVLFLENLEIVRTLGDSQAIAAVLNNLGNLAEYSVDLDAARALYEESLSIRRDIDDRSGIAVSLHNLGNIERLAGKPTVARALYEESLSIRRDIGDKIGIAVSLSVLSQVAAQLGEAATARALQEEGMALFQEVGDRYGISVSLMTLGDQAFLQGDLASAQRYFLDCIPLALEVGDKSLICSVLESCVHLAHEQQRWERAALLLEAMHRLCPEMVTLGPMGDLRGLVSLAVRVKEALETDALESVTARARRMTPEQVLALILEEGSVPDRVLSE